MGHTIFWFMMMIFYGMKAYTCCKIIEVLLVTRERVDLKVNAEKTKYVYVCLYVNMCVCVCVCLSYRQNAGQSRNIKTGKSPGNLQHIHIFGNNFNKSNLHLLRT
jgi:hypothetical protein